MNNYVILFLLLKKMDYTLRVVKSNVLTDWIKYDINDVITLKVCEIESYYLLIYNVF